LWACEPDAPTTAPRIDRIDAARVAASGPTVKTTDPDTGFRNTTLDVRILGSGFDNGSRVVWALNGDTTYATTRVKTNSTRYVKSGEVVANITIASDATLDLYDVVVVTLAGRKGIGIELFAVSLELVDLGTLGGQRSIALGLNNFGQVVGWSETVSGDVHAFLWTKATGMRDLGTLGGTSSEARSVNDAGTVVGVSASPASWRRAFRWTAGAGMQDIGGTAPEGRTDANVINADGDIGGQADEPKGTTPTVWTATARLSLDTAWARVTALNTVGQAAGVAELRGTSRAVVWQSTAEQWVMREVAPPNAYDSQAYGISAGGEVVGYYRRPTGGYGGFVWTNARGVIDLPPFPGGGLSMAYAINGSGAVAGFATKSSGLIHFPVIWGNTRSGVPAPQELPVLFHGDAEVRAINDRGEMAGFSSMNGAAVHAVVWRFP
jgi:probable HAF family extracellular repeat protein